MDRLRIRMRLVDRIDGKVTIKEWLVWWGPDALCVTLWVIVGVLWGQLLIEGRL